MQQIDEVLRRDSPFAKLCRRMVEIESQQEVPNLRMFIGNDQSKDVRRYNLPTATDEIALICTTPDGDPPSKRYVSVHWEKGGLQNIPLGNPCMDPMIYPLLFPHGELGYSYNIFRNPVQRLRSGVRNQNTTGQQKNVTQAQFYSSKLHVRNETQSVGFNPIFRSCKLFQQYIVDAWLRTEDDRLKWYRFHQAEIRRDSYSGLLDYHASEAQRRGVPAGQVFVLPTTHPGSTRALKQNYLDAMAIVAKLGKPDYFITFTCNPDWPEIQNALYANQSSIDRPDIVARVFNLKVKRFLKELVDMQILGEVIGYSCTIEFQKRGLPHCHLLLIVSKDHKPNSAEKIDAVVSAELPDPQRNKHLFDIVTKKMIHGPCGEINQRSPCMKGGSTCLKKFPKTFQPYTLCTDDAFPKYRRRDNSQDKLRVGNFLIDNSWVVPYNPYLLLKFNAHINVEVCSSVKSVKYIYKYIYKGHDKAMVVRSANGSGTTLDLDEIQQHIDARYVSAPEAIWRLFSFDMHANMHSIYRLPVHLPSEQTVFFEHGQEEEALQRAATRPTMLTAWFDLNKIDENAKMYTYAQIPCHYVFHNEQPTDPEVKKYSWTTRKSHFNIIPRLDSASPKNIERFSLRLLLMNVRGCTSWEDIRTVEGPDGDIIYDTFKEAALARGLIQSDRCWEDTMREALGFQMPIQLRQLLTTIAVHGGETVDVLKLWTEFQDELSEDFTHQGYDSDSSKNMALRHLQKLLEDCNYSLEKVHLPSPGVVEEPIAEPVDLTNLLEESETRIRQLNPEQRIAVANIITAISKTHPTIKVPDSLKQDACSESSKQFFIDGVGGSGKTFVYMTITAIVRSQGHAVIAVAPTGIAAMLLDGGQTAHSAFGIPLDIDQFTTCKISPSHEKGMRIAKAAVILWDEISMVNKHIFAAVDRLLKDLMQNKTEPFGGKVVVAGGDFRQQLPIKRRADRRELVDLCVQSSPMWDNFNVIKLHRNMRTGPGELEFSNYLMQVGNGELPPVDPAFPDNVAVPSQFVVKKTDGINSLVDFMYGSSVPMDPSIDHSKRAILCPLNEQSLRINEDVLERMEGDVITSYSIDEAIPLTDDPNDKTEYDPEILHGFTPTGMPPYKLNVKTGCIVMLLRNLNPKIGLCNGTRLIVEKALRYSLKCRIVQGRFDGQIVLIPKITLAPKPEDLPFKLSRSQFPIRLGFAMTISKSQGQTLERVGVYLPRPVFSHGQLYTAFSRVTSGKNLAVQIGCELFEDPPLVTTNIVWKEVLTDKRRTA